MSAPVAAAEPKMRVSRRRLASVVFFCVLLAIVIDAYRRQRHVQWLVSEIDAVGGHVRLPEPLLEQAWAGRWSTLTHGAAVGMGGSKFGAELERLPPDVDGAWLDAHNNLAGLRVTNLMIGGTKWTGADITGLVEQHPIDNFNAWGLQGADDAAHALENCATVRSVSLASSDLTDEGFRALPLEQLTRIEILRAQHLTSAGLRELRRCDQLEFLAIDDKQAEAAIPLLLEWQRPLGVLWLEGPAITGEDLERLHELKLRILFLSGTSVSEAAVENFRQKLPGCCIDAAANKNN